LPALRLATGLAAGLAGLRAAFMPRARAAVKHKEATNLTGVEDKLVRRILSPD